MNNKKTLEQIRKMKYDLQMSIGDDMWRFGVENKDKKLRKLANECRNEAWCGILRPDHWDDVACRIMNIDLNK